MNINITKNYIKPFLNLFFLSKGWGELIVLQRKPGNHRFHLFIPLYFPPPLEYPPYSLEYPPPWSTGWITLIYPWTAWESSWPSTRIPSSPATQLRSSFFRSFTKQLVRTLVIFKLWAINLNKIHRYTRIKKKYMLCSISNPVQFRNFFKYSDDLKTMEYEDDNIARLKRSSCCYKAHCFTRHLLNH